MRRRSVAEFDAWSGIVPIAIRPEVVVRIAHLPQDLTAAEARKISAVVMALANPSQTPADEGE